MANSLLTTSRITREAVMLFMNSNAYIKNVDRQFDKEYVGEGKIGAQLRIRMPNDYLVTKGPALGINTSTIETQTVLTMGTQSHVDLQFTSDQLTLQMEDFNERVLRPAMNNLAGQVAADLQSMSDTGFIAASNTATLSMPLTATTGGFCNLVANFDGSGNLLSPNQGTILTAGAVLSDNSATLDKRQIVFDPYSQARAITSMATLFNPQNNISKQYETGRISSALGFDFFMDQTVIKHTTGTFTAGAVNGAGQTGSVIVTSAITGTLNEGDIITIAGVNSVNRVTKVSSLAPRQFVVTAPAASGATSISIYPALIPSNAGAAVQYQTVDNSPASAAAITMLIKPGVSYRKNVAMVPEAVTMATAKMFTPPNVDSANAQYDGIALRYANQWLASTDQMTRRIDILYGGLVVRPEWGVVIADII